MKESRTAVYIQINVSEEIIPFKFCQYFNKLSWNNAWKYFHIHEQCYNFSVLSMIEYDYFCLLTTNCTSIRTSSFPRADSRLRAGSGPFPLEKWVEFSVNHLFPQQHWASQVWGRQLRLLQRNSSCKTRRAPESKKSKAWGVQRTLSLVSDV